MTTEKIALSMPKGTLAKARTAILNDLDDLLQELLRESGGPMTAAERRCAERVLEGTSKKTKGRRK